LHGRGAVENPYSNRNDLCCRNAIHVAEAEEGHPMELFSRDDLRALLENRRTPCVSVFMPTTRGPKHEDKTRWKNLVADAEERLAATGLRNAEVKDLLQPVHELLNDAPFWLSVSS